MACSSPATVKPALVIAVRNLVDRIIPVIIDLVLAILLSSVSPESFKSASSQLSFYQPGSVRPDLVHQLRAFEEHVKDLSQVKMLTLQILLEMYQNDIKIFKI